MPLNKEILKQGLINAQEVAKKASTVEQATALFAEHFANVIDAFIRSGDVTVNVVTIGSATTQTGTGQGKIN